MKTNDESSVKMMFAADRSHLEFPALEELMLTQVKISKTERDLLDSDVQLKSVAYVSMANGLSSTEIIEIARKADIFNRSIDVSGFLFSAAGLFLQVLEGSGPKFNQLLHRIENDVRHRSMKYVVIEEIATHQFHSWGMKLIEDSQLKHEHINMFLSLHQDHPQHVMRERLKEIIRQIMSSL